MFKRKFTSIKEFISDYRYDAEETAKEVIETATHTIIIIEK